MTASFRFARLAGVLLSVAVVGASHRTPQSGRGAVRGYVAFEDVAPMDVKANDAHAIVELHGSTAANTDVVYTARTGDTGSYDIPSVGMGEYTLRIAREGYRTWQADVYIPSDFECRLAVMLKKAGAGSTTAGDTR